MPRKVYTLTVLMGAVSWLLVGLHLPVLHDFTHPESSPRWGLVALTAGLAVLALAVTWRLLRAPARWARGSTGEPPVA